MTTELRLVSNQPAPVPPTAEACPRCDGQEWLLGADGGAYPCSCRTERVTRESLAVARRRVPPRYQHASAETWRGTWPLTGARSLPAGWPSVAAGELLRPWLLLVLGATPGAGKTHVGTAAYLGALGRLETPLAALWITAADAHRAVTEEIQARIAAEADGRLYQGRDTRRELHEAPLLLLDDVGRERSSEAARALIVSALMHRHAHCLPTIVTSNFGSPSGFDSYDRALTSRFVEDSVVVVLGGSDQRAGGAR